MKSLSLILRIVAILAACAAVTLFFMSKGKLAEKQTQLQQAQTATQTTQAELEEANGKITTLDSQLSTERRAMATLKDQLEKISAEMYTAKQEVTRTQQQLKETKSQITEYENTATRLRSDLVKTEQSLATASKEAELAQLNERIAELTKSNESLKQDLMAAEALKKSSAANQAATNNTGSMGTGSGKYSSNFKPNMSPAAKSASIGSETTIASISTADGIIILDARPEIGFTVGSEVTLIQNLTAIGKVQVIRVTETLAVANILPGTNLNSLAKGDSVKILF